MDKLKCGRMDLRTTKGNELTIVRWKDNKSMYAASNCDSSEPISIVQRWSKGTQAKIAVPQPFLIDKYKGMSGIESIKLLQHIALEIKPKSGGGHSLFGFQTWLCKILGYCTIPTKHQNTFTLSTCVLTRNSKHISNKLCLISESVWSPLRKDFTCKRMGQWWH